MNIFPLLSRLFQKRTNFPLIRGTEGVCTKKNITSAKTQQQNPSNSPSRGAAYARDRYQGRTLFSRLFQKSTVAVLLMSILLAGFGPSIDGLLSYESSYTAQATAETEAEEAARLAAEAHRAAAANDTETRLGELASMLVSVFTPLVALEVSLIGDMMSNDYVMGTAGDDENNPMYEVINKTWQVIRNLVNYAFIVVLLIIAFWTIISAGGNITGGDSNFELKQILPKFIIAVVAVNLTFFGAKVILDVASVATHIVYAIPKDVHNSEEFAEKLSCLDQYGGFVDDSRLDWTRKVSQATCGKVVSKVVILKGGTVSLVTKEGEKAQDWKLFSVTDGKKGPEITSDSYGDEIRHWDDGRVDGDIMVNMGWAEVYYTDFTFDKNFNENNIAALFAYGVMRVQMLPISVNPDESMKDLAINTLVALILMIVILIIFFALFLALIERVVIIWINIILAPIGVLMWVVKGVFSGADGPQVEYLGLGAFMKAAFFPATVGLPLVLGLTLIISGKSVAMPDQNAKVEGVGNIIDGVTDMHQLLWYVLSIGVIWGSMKIAEESTHFVKGAITGMKDGVENFSKFIVKLPLYAPWIPVKTKGGTDTASLSTLGRMKDNFMNSFEAKAQQKADDLMGRDMMTPAKFRDRYTIEANALNSHVNDDDAMNLLEQINIKADRSAEDIAKTAGVTGLSANAFISGWKAHKEGTTRWLAEKAGNPDITESAAQAAKAATAPTTPPTSAGASVSLTIGASSSSVTINNDGTVSNVRHVLDGATNPTQLTTALGTLSSNGFTDWDSISEIPIRDGKTYTITAPTTSGGAPTVALKTP